MEIKDGCHSASPKLDQLQNLNSSSHSRSP